MYIHGKVGKMKIKCLLNTMVLILFLLITTLIVPQKVSYAEDVWVYGDDTMAWYLSSETVAVRESKQAKYTCSVKAVQTQTGDFVNFHIYGFTIREDGVYCEMFNRGQGYWESGGKIVNDPFSMALWHAMYPYLKRLGVSDAELQ